MNQSTLNEAYYPKQSGTAFIQEPLGDLIRGLASKYQSQTALVELDEEGNNGRSWSYKELLEDSLKLAGILASRHKKGSRVVLWAGNCPEWVILEFAFGLAGVTLVTANPSIQAKELEYLLTQSKAGALYYMEEFRGNPLGDLARSVCSEIPSIKQLVLITDHDELFAGEGCDLPVVNHDDPAQI